MSPETRPLFLRCTADGKRFLMTTNSEAGEGGKAGHVWTVPVPGWVYSQLIDWITAAGVETGKVFRRVSSAGRPWADGVTEKPVARDEGVRGKNWRRQTCTA
jgi:hypothetical protein